MENIIKALEYHYIEYYKHNGRLMIKDEYTKDHVLHSNWIDATNWNMNQIKHWLGY